MHHRSRNLSRVIVWFYDDHMDVGKWPKSSPTCKLIENHPGSLCLSPASWAPICLLIRRHATIRQPSLGTLRWTFWTPSSYWPRSGRTFSRQCQFVPRKPFRIFMFASLQRRINVICQTCRWLHPRINQDLWQGHPSCRSCFWSHNFHLWTFDATREGKGTLCSKIP